MPFTLKRLSPGDEAVFEKIAPERMNRPSISSPPKPNNFHQMCSFLQMCRSALWTILSRSVRCSEPGGAVAYRN